MRLRTLGWLCLVLLPLPALADDPPAPPPPPWSGELSAGTIVTTGNSQTTTANAKGQVVYQSKIWRNTTDALTTKADQEDPLTGESVRTAERYLLGNKTDFNFTERDYAFFALEFEKDLEGAVRTRTSETAGYGRKIHNGLHHQLEAEIGAGARQMEEQVTRDHTDDAIGRARIVYKWKFSDSTYFNETAKVESGEENTLSESVSELRVTLIGKLFALGSYTVRNNSEVPAGTKKTDTITSVSLGWAFGK